MRNQRKIGSCVRIPLYNVTQRHFKSTKTQTNVFSPCKTEYFRDFRADTIPCSHFYSHTLKRPVEKYIHKHNHQLDGDMNLYNFKISYMNAYSDEDRLNRLDNLSHCFIISEIKATDLINKIHLKKREQKNRAHYE